MDETRWSFQPARPIAWLDRYMAKKILEGSTIVETGWGDNYNITRLPGDIYLIGKQPITGYELRSISSDRRVFILYPGGPVEPVEIREHGYASLVYTGPGKHYTLEKDGIHMHRVSGTDPYKDTVAKVNAAKVRPGDRVYDTCTGLGYTAIESVRRGAIQVLTVELDERVLRIAEENPYSRDLSSPKITILNDDTVDVAASLPDESFDIIIHDPPRFTAATGDLYSTSLYRDFYRILKPGGRLFHYTGSPMRKSARNLPGEVSGRLKRIGFKVYKAREALGLVAVKPKW